MCAEIKIWMNRNMLKLNDDKTEFIMFKIELCKFHNTPPGADQGEQYRIQQGLINTFKTLSQLTHQLSTLTSYLSC